MAELQKLEADELRADIAELEALRSSAKRPRSQAALDAALEEARKTLKASPEDAASTEAEKAELAEMDAPDDAPPAVAHAPVADPSQDLPVAPPSLPTPKGGWTVISKFGLDFGSYNSPTLSIYIDLPGVGAVKDDVEVSAWNRGGTGCHES